MHVQKAPEEIRNTSLTRLGTPRVRLRRGGFRMSANNWLLLVLGLVILAVGFDAFRGMQKSTLEQVDASQKPEDYNPPFKKGEVIPEIGLAGNEKGTDGKGLPDVDGKPRRLADLVKKDTLITFACGCAACKAYQTFLGEVLPKLGPNRPDVVTITTQRPEGEKAWKRDTKLPQVILYEPSQGVTGKLYRGHPCPRGFFVDGQLRAKWWTDNMEIVKAPDVIGTTTAKELGLPDKMPKVEAGSPGVVVGPEAAAPSPGIGPNAVPAGHGPGDGHGH